MIERLRATPFRWPVAALLLGLSTLVVATAVGRFGEVGQLGLLRALAIALAACGFAWRCLTARQERRVESLVTGAALVYLGLWVVSAIN